MTGCCVYLPAQTVYVYIEFNISQLPLKHTHNNAACIAFYIVYDFTVMGEYDFVEVIIDLIFVVVLYIARWPIFMNSCLCM